MTRALVVLFLVAAAYALAAPSLKIPDAFTMTVVEKNETSTLTTDSQNFTIVTEKGAIYAFRHNYTSYTEYQGKCLTIPIKPSDWEKSNPTTFFKNAKYLGKPCQYGPNKGITWELKDTDGKKNGTATLCTNLEGKIPFGVESEGKKVTFTKFTPGKPKIQLPALCYNQKKLAIPTSYFYRWTDTSGNAYTSGSGNTTRQANGDSNSFYDKSQYQPALWFKNSTRFAYTVYPGTNTCNRNAATSDYLDAIKIVADSQNYFARETTDCPNKKAKWTLGSGQYTFVLCTNEEGTIPFSVTSSFKNATFTDFRTTNLPAFKLPSTCQQ